MMQYLGFAIPFVLLGAMEFWQWRWNKRQDQALKDLAQRKKDLTQKHIDMQDWQQ